MAVSEFIINKRRGENISFPNCYDASAHDVLDQK
jgi:hypothetical protein